MRIFKRITAWALLCLLLLTVMAPTAFAAGDNNELSVHYTYDDEPIPEAQFHLFLVGSVAEDGALALTGDFSGYPVVVNGQSGSGLQIAADTLYGYIQRDQIQPNQSVETNPYGYATFFSLSRGLYLLAGQPCKIGDTLYRTQPQLIAVTEDLILEAKCEAQEDPTEPQTLSVLKKWSDTGYESKRPQSLSVSLVRDGFVVETVTLDAAGNWRHTWEDLEPGWQWSVVEECPKDYTVTMRREGDTFLLTNTRIVYPEKPSDTPTGSTQDPSIPQTGMVWWPVLVLLAGGLCLIALGARLRREERGDA